jgi:hypothetical protein
VLHKYCRLFAVQGAPRFVHHFGTSDIGNGRHTVRSLKKISFNDVEMTGNIRRVLDE